MEGSFRSGQKKYPKDSYKRGQGACPSDGRWVIEEKESGELFIFY